MDGSPVVTETAFFGVEHPLSINRGEMGYVRCFLPHATALLAGDSYTCSLVVGFVPEGQMRRGFLAYLERERAHPYRPFLHYNSWYDIGYFSKRAKGVLTLRNPSARVQGIKIDATKVFELPNDAPKHYTLISPFKDQHLEIEALNGGEEATFKLKPFEVLIFEALPAGP